jgi:AcrR family transcriptional regulator
MIQNNNNPIEMQAKILTAMKLFAKQGYGEMTNRVMADKVGMKEITVFRNLDTKKRLFKSILDDYTNLQTIQDKAQLKWISEPENKLLIICRIIHVKLHQTCHIMPIMFLEEQKNLFVVHGFKTMLKEAERLQIESLIRVLSPHAHEEIDWESAGVFLNSCFVRREIMTAMLEENIFHPQFKDNITKAVKFFSHGQFTGGE